MHISTPTVGHSEHVLFDSPGGHTETGDPMRCDRLFLTNVDVSGSSTNVRHYQMQSCQVVSLDQHSAFVRVHSELTHQRTKQKTPGVSEHNVDE